MPPLNTFSRTVIALAISQAVILPASAATIVVDTNEDDGSDCTLRDAILSINTPPIEPGCTNTGGAFGSNDTINFDSGLAGQIINLTGTELSIAPGTNLTINGLGKTSLTLSANSLSRVLYSNNATVSIDGVTFTTGSATNGGAIRVVSGSFTLSNSNVNYSSASNNGGALHASVSSIITITNSVISKNSASFHGGGIFATGSNTSVTLTDSTISGNYANYGGGANSRSLSSIIITNSSISGNSAQYAGGGLYAYSNAFISLDTSTVSYNTATAGIGGGIHNATSSNVVLNKSTVMDNLASNGGGAISTRATVSLTNSTVSGNSSSLRGGGIRITNGGLAILSNSTVSNNSAVTDGGGFYVGASSSINLSNSIISGNLAGSDYAEIDIHPATNVITNFANLLGESNNNNATAFSSVGAFYDNIFATSDGTLPTVLGSIISPLDNNGGSTEIHALTINSPAINAAKVVDCPDDDQIGNLRDKEDSAFFNIVAANGNVVVVDLGEKICDIGAVEFIPEK